MEDKRRGISLKIIKMHICECLKLPGFVCHTQHTDHITPQRSHKCVGEHLLWRVPQEHHLRTTHHTTHLHQSRSVCFNCKWQRYPGAPSTSVRTLSPPRCLLPRGGEQRASVTSPCFCSAQAAGNTQTCQDGDALIAKLHQSGIISFWRGTSDDSVISVQSPWLHDKVCFALKKVRAPFLPLKQRDFGTVSDQPHCPLNTHTKLLFAVVDMEMEMAAEMTEALSF